MKATHTQEDNTAQTTPTKEKHILMQCDTTVASTYTLGLIKKTNRANKIRSPVNLQKRNG